MFRWLWDWTPPAKPKAPILFNIEEVSMIRTTFQLAAVSDVPGDYDHREVSVAISNPQGTQTFGPYTKAQLNDADNPVKIQVVAERLATIVVTQKDFDTSGNIAQKSFSYNVVDRTPPADPLDPTVTTIEEI